MVEQTKMLEEKFNNVMVEQTKMLEEKFNNELKSVKD